MSLRARAGGLGCALALAVAAPAGASPVLDSADAVELAQALAEATAVQDVCYGWRVSLVDDSGGPSGDDVGSSFGPDVALDPGRCERWVILAGDIHYTAETAEAEDAAAVQVTSNLRPSPTLEDLRAFGVDGSLTDEDNDVVLLNMVGALPLAAAAKGHAPYVEFETSQAPAAQGEPTDSPGSDVLRQWWPLVALCVLAVLAGAFMLVGRVLTALHSRRRPPDGRDGSLTDAKGPDARWSS